MIIIQDSARICVDTIEKVIHLNMAAIDNSSAVDTVYTCEEKLPYVYDSQYFGETQTWSTEGTRRVNYEALAWNGCDSLVDVTLIVRKPKVEIAFDLDYCDAFTTTLSAESDDDIAQYKWSTGETTPTITITSPGTYSVEIQNEDGCSANNTITIPACKPFLNLPNTITPSNLDGMNDYFYIPQRSLIQELEFTVFNRNGEVVYHTTNKDFEWNGSVNGKLMVGSTFSYTLRITDYEGVSSTHKGSITVL
jgi:gliding motility-associated-like protein